MVTAPYLFVCYAHGPGSGLSGTHSTLQVTRRELSLESAIARLHKYHLLILDDISYVSKDQGQDQGPVRADQRAL